MAKKFSQRVGVAVTHKELAALRWNAKQQDFRRYPGRKPAAGAVLRVMSLEEAVRRYEQKEVRTNDAAQPAGVAPSAP